MTTISPDFEGHITGIQKKLESTAFVDSNELDKMSKTLRALAHQALPSSQTHQVIDLIGRVDTQAIDRKVDALVEKALNGNTNLEKEVSSLTRDHCLSKENLAFLRIVNGSKNSAFSHIDSEKVFSLLYDIAHAFYTGDDFLGEMLFNELPLGHRNALKKRFPKPAFNQIVNYTLRPEAIMNYVGALKGVPDLGSSESLVKLFEANP